ncbi:MAG: glycosyltransferase family 39 protein [Candidatus Omnitrophota bacterium]
MTIRIVFVLNSVYVPSSDAASYDQLGLALKEGRGYVDAGGAPHSFYPPLYPVFLSTVYSLFGHSYPAARVIQSVLGAIACVLIYMIGKGVYSRTVGVWAALISAVYAPFIKAGGLLLTESFFTFILLLIVLYLIRVRERGYGPVDCSILGFLMGVSLLTKTMMLFFPLFAIPLFLRKGRFSGSLKMCLFVLLAFAVSAAPWVIRNHAVYHRFIPASASAGGIGLYSSYCPERGVFGLLASQDDPVVVEANRISDPVLRSDFYIKKTFEFIRRNPGKVFFLELRKVLYFWAPFDWEIVGGRWFNFIYIAALPFFALGFILALKGFWANYPVLIPIIYFQAISLVFYGSPRFRLPVEPYIFILSIFGIVELLKRIKRKPV